MAPSIRQLCGSPLPLSLSLSSTVVNSLNTGCRSNRRDRAQKSSLFSIWRCDDGSDRRDNGAEGTHLARILSRAHRVQQKKRYHKTTKRERESCRSVTSIGTLIIACGGFEEKLPDSTFSRRSIIRPLSLLRRSLYIRQSLHSSSSFCRGIFSTAR